MPVSPDLALPNGSLDWLAPARVLCTTRAGGVSRGAYRTNNLAFHVHDDPGKVSLNRSQLSELNEITSIYWLDQVHGTRVVSVTGQCAGASGVEPQADAMYTTERGVGLAILTADCLPVVVVDVEGEVVAAAHAGWRGLCAGILRELITCLPVPAARLKAFIGPAIGAQAFEVGEEVVAALAEYGIDSAGTAGVAKQGRSLLHERFNEPRSTASASAISASTPESNSQGEKYLVDLALAAKFDLQRLGVRHIAGGDWCTATDERFYSWRRETHRAKAAGESPVTGRQATIIWLPAS